MTQVEQLEHHLKNAKDLAARRRAALKLAENREFKRLILDEFCGSDAARFVQESGDPALNAQERADCLAMAQASGHLKRFLQMVIKMGEVSERQIPEIEEALDEARSEEAQGDVGDLEHGE